VCSIAATVSSLLQTESLNARLSRKSWPALGGNRQNNTEAGVLLINGSSIEGMLSYRLLLSTENFSIFSSSLF
jgi:hypothetical protein